MVGLRHTGLGIFSRAFCLFLFCSRTQVNQNEANMTEECDENKSVFRAQVELIIPSCKLQGVPDPDSLDQSSTLNTRIGQLVIHTAGT